MSWKVLDIFSKPVEDSRVRTNSGGIISVGVVFSLCCLIFLQFKSYCTLVWDHSLEVDTFANDEMLLSLDISFPHLPCEQLTVDMSNNAGDNQIVAKDHLKFIDLDKFGNLLDPSVKESQRERQMRAIEQRDLNKKWSCYGAENALPSEHSGDPQGDVDPQDISGKKQCLTCDQLCTAFKNMMWPVTEALSKPQCIEEGMLETLNENKENGCRVTGNVVINRIEGRIHFAPGESTFIQQQHFHDLAVFLDKKLPFDFTHEIHGLSFGSTVHGTQPLQNYKRTTPQKLFQYRYFMKVVGTELQYANGEQSITNQYSVTHHERPLEGGRDEDHPHTAHSQGGTPGVWLNYDISSMKVVEKQVRELSFAGLLMNIFAVIGAVITFGAVLDRGVHVVDQALQTRKVQ